MKKYSIIVLGGVLFPALIGAVYFSIMVKPGRFTSQKTKSLSSAASPEDAQALVAKPTQRPPAPPKSEDQDQVVRQIRSELQAVMDLNQKINSAQQSQSAQLLRIQEQAQIHQRILGEIQKTTVDKKIQTPSHEALLAQEKLRVIREETLRNKKTLDDNLHKPAA